MPNIADPEIWHFSELDIFFLFFLVSVNCIFGEQRLVTCLEKPFDGWFNLRINTPFLAAFCTCSSPKRCQVKPSFSAVSYPIDLILFLSLST